ncbi:MAG: sulfurtransferase TusA family protein [Nitrospirota bacterium]
MEKEIEYNLLVDIRGICCAQPIIRLAKELKNIEHGEVILAVSDKTSMLNDIPAFCNKTNNQLIHHEEVNGVLRFWIKKI